MKRIYSRRDLEGWEEGSLAPYALRSAASKGREHEEPEHPLRSAFQRDLARIIHCKAFRRLEYKTQVFVNHEGDHYRTRLTHSLEVAQIARTAARILGLNEDLAECISLAHDLGHTPFGHSGEERMDELMRGHGGFEHNRQSLRVVTYLEKNYPGFAGLNLTFEVRDGISKHFTDYDNKGLQTGGHYSLEAEVVNLADEIAYNNHDLDDGLRSEMITLGQLERVEIWQREFENVRREMPGKKASIIRHQTVRRLINWLVSDLIESTAKRLQEANIRTHAEVVGRSQELVGFSPEVKKLNMELKRFLFKNLYQHYRVIRMAKKAQRTITDLFHAYVEDPRILPLSVQEACVSQGVERSVCDYIAGMTDRFALEEHAKLFHLRERV